MPRAGWRVASSTRATTSCTWSSPPAAKPAGGFRIVCLGDSVTFGFRVPLVFPDKPTVYDPYAQPYPRLLEDRLRAANPGRWIEVIALAVPGYSSHQGRAWLQRAA